MKVTTFLFGALFAATATSIPVEELGKRQLANNPVTDQQLADAKANYKGIYWESAAKTCTKDQFAILMESTRVALDIMSWDYRSSDSPGFTRFFGDAKLWVGGSAEVYSDFNKTIINLRQVADFPRVGRRDKRQYKISYYCGDVEHYTNCLRKSNVPAYTIRTHDNQGKIDGCGTCNAIGFCPLFWNADRVKYTNDVLKTKPSLADLASINTYEHALIHEFMHNNITTVTPPIFDIEDNLSELSEVKKLAYGARNCAQYADKWKKSIGTKVNTRTMENADSYAWMLTNNYFNKKLGWGDNGHTDIPFEGDPTKRSLVSARDDGPPTLYPLDEVAGDDNNIIDGDQLPATALVTIPTCQNEATCEYTADDDLPPDATPAPPPPPANGPLRCNGLASHKYIPAPSLDDKIAGFCSGLQAQGIQDTNSGSYGRVFNAGTREEVELFVDWPPGQKLDFQPCAATMGEISASCDGNDPTNPRNWKGGGSKVVGGGNFRINPRVTRSSPPAKFCPDSKPTGDLTTWKQNNVCGDICPDGYNNEGGSDPKVARFAICALSDAVKNCSKAFAQHDELPFCWIEAV